MSHLRHLLVAATVAACLGIVISALRVPRNHVAPPPTSAAPIVIRGFRSLRYDGNRLRLRVSGDSAALSNARFLGPLSFGFLYSLVVRNLTVETFPGLADVREQAPVPSFTHLSELVPQEWSGVQIGHAVLERLRVVEHRLGAEKVVLQAAICETTFGKVVCSDGTIDRDGNDVPFRTLSYDGKSLRITR